MPKLSHAIALLILPLLISVTGCGNKEENAARSQPQQEEDGQPIAVNVEIARSGGLANPIEYIGTTQPLKIVSLRSQVEGRLLVLGVDVGDRVRRGQVLARLDDSILATSVNEAEAQLAAFNAEIERGRTQVNNARTALEGAKIEWEQAKNDAERYATLAKDGAVSQREAELFQTAVEVAEQTVNAARENIKTEERAIEASLGQLAAQRAILAREQQRQTFARLNSPINGLVLERISEPGNLVTAGEEVLKLGDFSQIKAIVPLSELDLSGVGVGQPVNVQLDAFGDRNFPGRVTRISPVADPTSRQIPVEVTFPNFGDRVGSGLLARVTFAPQQQPRIIIPERALQKREDDKLDDKKGVLFVLQGEDRVATREVFLGDRVDGKVEILSGISDGDRFVINSAKPLKDGDIVRQSILSPSSQ
ncbi:MULTISPECIES: efflux RND transporter periplasmic adaptor subunit [Spirulina sp. CCY15215]|uniref:efflux RND transporter periplasmic adaptor subunit n=1 Tax=Spirulina sp. CCY15215 TaxID=2767591 RepID=UPI00195297F6|nr:efflux RND transporter periplasmic adaptor subunit [Spirulina major]